MIYITERDRPQLRHRAFFLRNNGRGILKIKEVTARLRVANEGGAKSTYM